MLISDAFAQAAAPAQSDASSLISLLPMVGILIIFYFLLIRPQSKRAKEHKQMVEALQRGDEVITNGGILGLVVNVSDDYVIVEIAPSVEVTLLRSSAQTLLPKGTLRSIEPKGGKIQKTKATKTTVASENNKAGDTNETSDNQDHEAEKNIEKK